jgi:hypothetical protein
MAAWAADTDAAECSRLYRRLPPETFRAEASESAGYTVRFSAKLNFSGSAGIEKSRVWLYFPAVRGDIQVRVQQKTIGIRAVPREYHRRYSWALDLGPCLTKDELDLSIDAQMPGLPEQRDGLKSRNENGVWYGLLLPPEIGVEDGGTRETANRVSPPPEIFGFL